MWTERELMGSSPLHFVYPPGFHDVHIVFKNESASRTGSLKHRYSWALIMWALLEGHVKNGTHVFEASSGNTACSLSYMCRVLGLKFTAVVPDTIEEIKVKRIERQDGIVIKVPISNRLIMAETLARSSGGFFMNQFKNAFHAEEFHDSGSSSKPSTNLFHELINQLDGVLPGVFVHPAGTGGTISSVGRYIKKYGLKTQIVMADTQYSIYSDYVLNGSFSSQTGSHHWVTPGMAGIGYGAMGPAKIAETTSLDPAVIDRILKIPDLASTAAMRVARELGIDGGTSTGVNFLAALHLASVDQMRPITIATILADSGKYYESTYLNREWISDKFSVHGGLPVYDCWIQVIKNSYLNGDDPLELGNTKCSVVNFR
uniref:PALP domain-containing protein n=1 Tax=Caenorhabditis tropicalis TaxID=1561998 RepID=A0A1I7TG23_9PELO